MASEEKGYVKFDCDWQIAKPLPKRKIFRLNHWRSKLFNIGLIGVHEDGIGFGNISERTGKKSFVISGTATGRFVIAKPKHYCTVVDFSFEENWLKCFGPVKASAESLTHAAVYQASKKNNAVIHVHSKKLWNNLVGKFPTTGKKFEYGTPELAMEVLRLFKETNVAEQKVFVLGGHEDGIIAFGKSLNEAGKILLCYFKQNRKE
jgi:hypothetical protein